MIKNEGVLTVRPPEPGKDVEARNPSAPAAPSRRRKGRRKARLTIPAWMVFGIAVLFSIASIVLVSRIGASLLPLLLVSIGFNVWVLMVGESHGFSTRKSMRRAFEPRRHLTLLEVLTLFGLLLYQVYLGLPQALDLIW